ncbi:GIY-YIG nuclease family protein [Candidatus Shapirobacteria bacterium]|nr:GIY-YIG nuclease family protein [Candidatus Shapirobacteria bacterium]
MFFVYILRTARGTLYTGQTNNLERRLKQHNGKSQGAKYTKINGGGVLVYSEKWGTRAEVCKREAEIKRMSKNFKEKLVVGWQKL